ncbi:hypothetical protein BKA70DRAFT_1215856 [Coprinopsis sp. MPI-PUGE-AT-0042]|nr:hypothetical protein BKA70DRAFT_1215856 [Coprinopsis sp. MPI-PUGE-AT-0042]
MASRRTSPRKSCSEKSGPSPPSGKKQTSKRPTKASLLPSDTAPKVPSRRSTKNAKTAAPAGAESPPVVDPLVGPFSSVAQGPGAALLPGLLPVFPPPQPPPPLPPLFPPSLSMHSLLALVPQISPGPSQALIPTPSPSKAPDGAVPLLLEDGNNSDAGPVGAKRIQPSNSNPIFGVVDGVGRGKRRVQLILERLAIARTRPLKKAIGDQRKATKSYHVLVNEMVTRCESLSSRTGCWLYFAVQHPDAKTPFVHFSSLKLRREASTDLKEIHAVVAKTMSNLVRADRVSKVDLLRSQAIVEEQATKALDRAAQAEDEVDRLKRLLSAYTSL